MHTFKFHGSDDSGDVVDKPHVGKPIKSTDTPDFPIKFQPVVVLKILKATPRELFDVRWTKKSLLFTLPVVLHNWNKLETFHDSTATVDKTLFDICVQKGSNTVSDR